MVKWQPTKKTTIDGKEVEIPKYFEIEDDKFGKIVFGEESFQGDMMRAEKQILEGTAAIKTLESIYADEKLSAEIKKINADACSAMAQAAYFYAAGETPKSRSKSTRSKKENRRSNRRSARTPILDRNSEYDHQVGTISGEPGNRRKNRKSNQRIHGKKDERNTPQEFIDSNTTLRSGDEI